MRRRFFVKGFEAGRAALRADAAQHLARVLRAAPGQLYELSDGQAVWLARVAGVQRDAVEFELVEQLPATEPPLRISLLLSVIKFDRFEWCLEKATELGVAQIIPLAAARTEKALLAAAAKRARRWEKLLMESAQQSRRLRAPALAAAIRPADAFSQSRAEMKVILSESRESPRLREMVSGPRPSTVALAIGPEGGWTDAECESARAAGFVEASLGGNILRSETAVIAALAVFNYALGD
jgi:16S rRNA (uracil1498-N3)-methyltransferase